MNNYATLREFLQITILYFVQFQKIPMPTPMRVTLEPKEEDGGGVKEVAKATIFQEKYEAKLEFPVWGPWESGFF